MHDELVVLATIRGMFWLRSHELFARPFDLPVTRVSAKRKGFVVVTGASRGLGAATAIALAEAGYDVGVNYREEERRARKVATRVENLGARAVLLPGDISTPEGRQQLLDNALKESGRLDGLVLNASGGLEKGSPPDYLMRLNCDAQVALVRRAAPHLARSPAGRIVFVTSNQAHQYPELELEPGYEPVAASKHAGEQELRNLIPGLRAMGVQLVVATSDGLDDHPTTRLPEWANLGMLARRRAAAGWRRSFVAEFASVIVRGITDRELRSGEVLEPTRLRSGE
ncbi:SDR family oxidoreductase [Flindersiella endophytica]